MTPILKYPGAKWRLAPWIIERMPPHIGYVEPFAGSCAVLLNKPMSRIETINDLDGEVVNFFRVCREYPAELAQVVNLTPWSREEHGVCVDQMRRNTNVDPVERARRFLVATWQTFGATHGSRSWKVATGSVPQNGPDNAKLWCRLPNSIVEVAERLKLVQIEQRPAVDVLRRFNGPEVLVYADPPYVKGTRTAHGDQYRYEMNDNDHVELLDALNDHKGMVMLSGYDCEMYRDMLGDWRMETVSTVAERGVGRTECLWLNPRAAERTAQISVFDVCQSN